MVHFVLGRYCNYKSNQLMGVNLAAPVVQLQVPFAMMLAVATLHEKFTVLQVIGSVLMLGGSFVAQTRTGKGIKKGSATLGAATPIRTVTSQQQAVSRSGFRPHIFSGYLFALGAAMCYGSSPLMARQAFLNAPGAGTAAAGCLAYTAATLLFSLILLRPGSWDDIRGMSSENLPWFLSSAVLVAISQAFVYASLAVAPLMVVTPILQLSLVFRLFLSELINRDYEVMNTAVLVGALTAVLGSILVSLGAGGDHRLILVFRVAEIAGHAVRVEQIGEFLDIFGIEPAANQGADVIAITGAELGTRARPGGVVTARVTL